MNYSDIFAKHGLVLVQASDIRKMMDYYQIADTHMKDENSDEGYIRLWDSLHEVGLDYAGSREG